MVAGKWV